VGLVDRLIEEKDLPQWLKFELWGKTRSSVVIPYLLALLQDEDFESRSRVVDTISQLGDALILRKLLATSTHHWKICDLLTSGINAS
jgi:HEAT repeat protein